MDTRLEPLEPGATLVVEGDDLAVHDGLPGAELLTEGPQLGKRTAQIVAVPGPDPESSTVDVADGPYAVPLEFVGPRVVVLRQGSEGRQHGPDLTRGRLVVRGIVVHAVHHPVTALAPA